MDVERKVARGAGGIVVIQLLVAAAATAEGVGVEVRQALTGWSLRIDLFLGTGILGFHCRVHFRCAFSRTATI